LRSSARAEVSITVSLNFVALPGRWGGQEVIGFFSEESRHAQG
jgi:hypothetical protein